MHHSGLELEADVVGVALWIVMVEAEDEAEGFLVRSAHLLQCDPSPRWMYAHCAVAERIQFYACSTVRTGPRVRQILKSRSPGACRRAILGQRPWCL